MTTSAASYRCCAECLKRRHRNIPSSYVVRSKHGLRCLLPITNAETLFLIFGAIAASLFYCLLTVAFAFLSTPPTALTSPQSTALHLNGTCTIGRDGTCERYLSAPELNCEVYLGGEEIPKSHVTTSTILKIKDVYFSAGRDVIYQCTNTSAKLTALTFRHEEIADSRTCKDRGGILVAKCLSNSIEPCPDAWIYWKCEDPAK